VSGSGKSTLSKKLLLEYGGFTFAEADQFMVDSAGKYSFNPKLLTFAHESCVNKVEKSMMNEENIITVSNTSIAYWEMYNYVVLAQKYGYDIEFREPETEWRYNQEILYEMNNHSVPLEAINRQLENLKNNPTLSTDLMIERILATCGCRPTNYRQGINIIHSKLIYYGTPSTDIIDWIEKLKSLLGEKYVLYNRNRSNRDGGPLNGIDIYHLTLTGFSPDDKLTSEQTNIYIEGLKNLSKEVSPQFIGLGKVQNEENESYYILVKWDEVNLLREKLGLIPLNLHITLGYHINDIHDLPKTLDTLISQ